ncbi:hypothetical protein ACPXCG_18810 [Gordonia sp. DT218]|uniref:hypothetical protein n=1 Tax=Gordonia sp. DT218 TaxID=3416659 RepID=UPI003CFAF25F
MASDPAVEAAQRAWRDRYYAHDANEDVATWSWLRDVESNGPAVLAVAAAREALAPLHPLIESARQWKAYESQDCGDVYAAGPVDDLLYDLSRLIYPSEELS